MSAVNDVERRLGKGSWSVRLSGMGNSDSISCLLSYRFEVALPGQRLEFPLIDSKVWYVGEGESILLEWKSCFSYMHPEPPTEELLMGHVNVSTLAPYGLAIKFRRR